MFVLQRDVTAAKKVIATLLATAMVLWAFGVHTFAEAANITDVSVLVGSSAPGATSNHTIDFITPTGVTNGGTVTIEYPAGFTGIDNIVIADVEVQINGTDDTTNWALTSVTSNTITLTIDTGTVAAEDQVTVIVGEEAAGGAGVNRIVNPTSPQDGNESYEINISAGTSDSGYARVVILDTVLVTANVQTTFDFTVTGLPAGSAVNGTTTDITTTSTTIPFGTLTAYVPRTGAQDLQVETNAANGFVVTVQSDGAFRSSTGADIDGFVDSSYTAVPTSWESPLVGLDILDEDTWGHWGITTEDNDGGISGTNELFGGDVALPNEFIGVTTTPRAIFIHDGPADNLTPAVGSTTVGYQVEISPLQEAGDDYQTRLTYIATPTF